MYVIKFIEVKNFHIFGETKTLNHTKIHGIGKKLSSTGFNFISKNNKYNGIK